MVLRVFLSDSKIYPLDNLEVKRKFFDLLVKQDLITLSDDPQGNLEGFLVSYRSWNGEPLNKSRASEQTGNSVTVDLIWIREDLRGTETIKRLIRHALLRNKDRNAGAEKIFIHWRQGPDKDMFIGHDYPSFFRKYTKCQDQVRSQHSKS